MFSVTDFCWPGLTGDKFLSFLYHRGTQEWYTVCTDDFQIVSDSNSLGDSILIWDFLDTVPLGCMQTHQLRDKHNSLLMYIRRYVHT